MARKQILANKRRSQKRSNKKRARTIRSMRQVNGGVWFSSRAKVGDSTLSEPLLPQLIESGVQGVDESQMTQRYGRQKGKSIGTQIGKLIGRLTRRQDEPILQPLLQDAAPVDESTYEQNFPLQQLMAPPVSSDLKEKVFSESKFDEDNFDEDLRTLLQFHVEVAFPTEQNLEKINEFIFNSDNRNIVLSPLINYIKDRLVKNLTLTTLLFQTFDDNIYNKKKKSIDTRLYELMKYAEQFGVYDLFKSIKYQLIEYVLEDKYLLSKLNTYIRFGDIMEAAKTIGTLTFLNIFNDSIFNDSKVVPDTIQESEFLRHHVDSIVYRINEQIKLTAGGSKGNMKSKMSRRKSRTRKS